MDTSSLTQAQFRDFSELINERLGIKMPEAKKVMLQSRIQRRARALNLDGPADYYRHFFSDTNFRQREMEELLNLATTNKTDFLREPDHFRFLSGVILPEHLARPGSGELRIWCAGCSTGEEPYTLAMVLLEERKKRAFEFSIVATDVSTTALRHAMNATYAIDRVAALPTSWHQDYLVSESGRHPTELKIAPDVRRRVSFGHLNFLADRFGVPGPFDVIFFRNVMIYFDRPTQKSVIDKMVPKLRNTGYLLTAHAETIHGLGLPFRQVSTAVYQKIGDNAAAARRSAGEEALC